MDKIFKTVRDVRDSISSDKTITLIAGCFDLLHVGHLYLMEYAKGLEDLLVVCVLSDKCVQSYKSVGRPVIKEEYRAQMVSGLACVDRVYIADKSPSDYETLSVLRPQSLVYGLENSLKVSRIVDSRISRIRNQFPSIKIHCTERSNGPLISTSGIIEKIINTAH